MGKTLLLHPSCAVQVLFVPLEGGAGCSAVEL